MKTKASKHGEAKLTVLLLTPWKGVITEVEGKVTIAYPCIEYVNVAIITASEKYITMETHTNDTNASIVLCNLIAIL